MATLLDEMVEKAAMLSDSERRELVKLLEKEIGKSSPLYFKISKNIYKLDLNPDIEWLKINRKDYAGKYVALKDGKLVAVGKTFKEVHLKTKELEIEKPFIHYLPAEDEILWGGW